FSLDWIESPEPEPSNLRTFEPSDLRTFGPSDPRTLGPLYDVPFVRSTQREIPNEDASTALDGGDPRRRRRASRAGTGGGRQGSRVAVQGLEPETQQEQAGGAAHHARAVAVQSVGSRRRVADQGLPSA